VSFRPKAVLLDFYGTVVEENVAAVTAVGARIAQASKCSASPTEVAQFWDQAFERLRAESFGGAFRTQRELETLSITQVLCHFGSDLDVVELTEPLFGYWSHPRIFPESKRVLENCDVPMCIVSNIDRADLEAALEYHQLDFDLIVTSEDCRAYKPRPEMFGRALSLLRLAKGEVLHVGDSLGSDIHGAKQFGIHALWLNRTRKLVRDFRHTPDHIIEDLSGLLNILHAGA